MSHDNADLQRQLKALQDEYLTELPQRLLEISEAWARLRAGWDGVAAKALYGYLHRMAGAGASFGCAELSVYARSIEKRLEPYVKEGCGLPAHIEKQIAQELHRLKASVPSPARSIFSASDPNESVSTIQDEEAITLYLLEDDVQYARSIALQLNGYGYRTSHFDNVDDFREAMTQQLPNILMVDIMLGGGELAGTGIIQEIREDRDINVPVVVFSERDDFEARISAVKAGASAYFVKPVEVDQLVVELDKYNPQGLAGEPLKILIVDDDAKLAAHYALVLAQAGMDSSYLTNPAKACEVMADFAPDLVVTDIYMPECSGMELASLIRQYPQYQHIPIVFLSTEAQLDKQLTALKIGGDDFLTKPIEDEHLRRCIAIRATRARALNELMAQDSLTGLRKHAVIKERLKSELSRAKRLGSTLAFVMIDLDFFKRVNDQYGHLVGDRVLKSLARLLRSRYRASDLIGRYGGEEFAMILPDCTIQQARQTVDEIRELFSRIEFAVDGKAFKVTFSAGIAEYPDYEASEALNQAADEALYEAKKRGRNRVEVKQP